MGKDKDPNRPKRAQSAYFIYMGDLREKCKRTGEIDTSNVTEFTKLASRKWKALKDAEKKPWEDRAVLDKQRYESEMAHYTPAPGYGKASKKKSKDPYAPKRPKSGYLFYLDYFRAKHPELGHKDVVSKGAESWSKMSEDAKRPFQEQHEKAKEEYTLQLSAMNR